MKQHVKIIEEELIVEQDESFILQTHYQLREKGDRLIAHELAHREILINIHQVDKILSPYHETATLAMCEMSRTFDHLLLEEKYIIQGQQERSKKLRTECKTLLKADIDYYGVWTKLSSHVLQHCQF